MFRFCNTATLLCITITFCSAQKPSNIWSHKPSSDSRSAGIFLYNLITTTATYTDLVNPISINNGEPWDQPEYSFPIGFPFEVLGDTVDEFIFTGSGSEMGAPTGVPYVYTTIAPFEADLMDRGGLEAGDTSISPISYVVEGEPGNRIFKLEFKNAGSYFEYQAFGTNDMFINFQMWLYEGSNIIQFRFGPNFIDQHDVFYDGYEGAIIAVLTYDEFDDIRYDPHFLTGNSVDPYLSEDLETINGTPSNGTVYTLYLDIPLDLNFLVTQNNSYCAPNSTIEAQVTGGLAPYTYVWFNGETTPIINVTDAGTYTVIVTDQIGNTVAREVVITNPEQMTLAINATQESGAGANDGTAEVTVTNGLPPYSFGWSNGQTTSLIDDLAPGIYQVTVTDDAGCSETAEAVINPFSCMELVLEAGIDNNQCAELCEGNITIVDVVNGHAPFTYAWDNGGTNPTIDQLCAGFYTVTITDANLCFVMATYEVTSPTPVVVNASSTNETIEGLNDGTATTSPTGGTPPYFYSWSNGDTTQTITGLTPGTYYILVGDSLNCHGLDTVIIEAGQCAILTGTVTDATCYEVCDGSIEVLLGGFPPAEVTWTGGNGGSLDGELCAGEYSISATDGQGCSVVDTFIVGQPEQLLALAGSTSETIAGDDGSAWLIPIGGTLPYSYLWSTGSTDSLITALIPDTYYITLTDGHGCSYLDSVQVDPFYCFHIIPDVVQNVFCQNSCEGLIFVTIDGGVGPFEYAWSNGDTSNFVFDLCAGPYSVTVTDLGQGSCEEFIDIEIMQPDSFYAIVDEVVHVTDSTEGSIHISINGGVPPYFYLWFGPEGFNSGEEDLSGLEPGVYIFNAFDANDCDITDTIEILDLIVGLPDLAEGVVSIYPNPANDFIYVKTELPGDYTVELFSALGSAVGSWQNATRIDVGHLTQGIYLVAFSNGRGRFVERVVIK